ncbi:hypothetical protein CYMTET_28579, partial [Cymbomonas tetramitiformis]
MGDCAWMRTSVGSMHYTVIALSSLHPRFSIFLYQREEADSPASAVRPRVTSATGLLINIDGESIPLDYRPRNRFLPR